MDANALQSRTLCQELATVAPRMQVTAVAASALILLVLRADLSSSAVDPPCSVQSLTNKILTTRDGAWRPSRRFNEVHPGIVAGEGTNALIHPILQKLQITHVLNCAATSEEDMRTRISRQIEYPHEYEEAFNITVKGLPIHDEGSYQIGPLFQEGADFIEDVLDKGGRVYVNSFTGSSRAGTILVGYFIIKHGYTASNALHLVRLGREVRPDKGFLSQLCELEQQLNQPPTTTEILTTTAAPTTAAPTTAEPTTTANPTTTAAATTTGEPKVRPPWQPPKAIEKWLDKIFGK